MKSLFAVLFFASLIATELSLRMRIDLRFDRALILSGQWWRLATGPFMHLNEIHFAWNMAALFMIGLLFRTYVSVRHAIWLTVALVLGIGICFLIAPFGWNWYMGFSGVLHGLFASGALISARRDRRAYALFALVVAKVIYELLYGGELFWSVPVVTIVHVYGVVIGALWAFNERVWKRSF